jgi:hypothetical protein
MTSELSQSRNPDLLPMWPSVARIAATFAIFLFHYLGLLGLNQHRLSMYALDTFLFLTGYLAQHRHTSRLRWAAKRYFSVMIPYWLIIGPALVANWVAHYKPITPGAVAVTLMGGNLFLANPVYVITWYVTFVLLLYGYLLVDSCFSGVSRLVVTAAGYVVFDVWLDRAEYFIPFILGMYIGGLVPPRPVAARSLVGRRAARALFTMQRLCYPFFLAHGGLQLALVRFTSWSPVTLFVVSLTATIAASVVVELVSEPLLRVVIGRLPRRQAVVRPVAVPV